MAKRRKDLLPKVSAAKLDRYRAAKSRLETETWGTIEDMLKGVDYTSISKARNEVIAIMNGVMVDACDASAVLSANFYDICRESAGLSKSGALAVSNYDPVAMDHAVRGMIQSVINNEGDTKAFENELKDRVGYLLNRTSDECLYANAKRDERKVLHEWTTQSDEPCEMCLYLEEQGAVSYNTDMEHYHAYCQCVPVPVWSLSPSDKGAPKRSKAAKR